MTDQQETDNHLQAALSAFFQETLNLPPEIADELAKDTPRDLVQTFTNQDNSIGNQSGGGDSISAWSQTISQVIDANKILHYRRMDQNNHAHSLSMKEKIFYFSSILLATIVISFIFITVGYGERAEQVLQPLNNVFTGALGIVGMVVGYYFGSSNNSGDN